MKNKNLILSLACFLCLPIGAASFHGTGELKYGIATQSTIDLRLNPEFESEMGTEALMGMPLEVLDLQDGWLKLKTPEGYISWSPESSVRLVTKEELREWNKAEKLFVTDYFTVLHQKASDQSPVVCDVVKGDLVKSKGETGAYYKVELPDGRSAFLKKGAAMPFGKWLASRNPTPQNIIATARLFMGFPYSWGGTSVKGLDCSGFTKTCYYLNGVVLLRDASQQAQTGDPVDISTGYGNLRPGDLLFFGSCKDGQNKVTHVGLYIGNGEFIHSSGSVRTSSLLPESPLYDSWNAGRLLLAKRIITEIDKDPNIVSLKNHPMYR
ncbi:MAG: ykfC [Bacteroidetes bacterium]|nr:ykfC [Bacteroidota bacterium]